MTDHPAPTAPARATAPTGASAWVTVDAAAIRDNVAALVRRCAPAQVMAVVKADAYGHGLVTAARAALAGGAAWLGVAQLEEALALRAAGVDAPLLTWIYPPQADLGAAIDADIDLTVGSRWNLDAVVAAARQRGTTARVQAKVDTGLGRGGVLTDWSEFTHALAAAVAEGAVRVTGTWSHFAWADAPQHPTVRAQQERFVEAVAELEAAGVDPGLRHLANSAATLTNPSAHFDLVRPGLAVYGLSPVPDLGSPADFGLREAMRVTARLTQVKRARRAGRQLRPRVHDRPRHRARPRPDGLRRRHPAARRQRRARAGRGPPAHHRRAGLHGPVRPRPRPRLRRRPGDEVTILGRGADGEPTAQDWAEAAGTINYEVVTRMAPRLPRVVVGEGV